MRLIALLSIVVMAAALPACDDTTDGGDGGTTRPDGATPEDGGDVPEPDDDAGICSADSDCSDDNACDGIERCEEGSCVEGDPLRCTEDHQCLPAVGCDCADPDRDNDGVDAQECLPPGVLGDCNDHNPAISPAAFEVCHEEGDAIDEDCRPATYSHPTSGDGDRDRDGFINALCVNYGPDGEPHGGDDCNDDSFESNLLAEEICDLRDNDCDKKIDEGRLDGMGEVVPYGQQIRFYPDADHDGSGDQSVEPKRACEGDPPVGHVPWYLPADCDDANPDINIHETELCDGRDNDCDDLIDQADQNEQPLLDPYDFVGTEDECFTTPDGDDDDLYDEGHWEITFCPEGREWCSGVVETGCSTDITTIENCGDCDVQCTFACGGTACDELTTLALGSDHSCGLTGMGHVACWGRASEGRLGNDSVRNTGTPSRVIGASGATQVAAGPNNACAVIGAREELHCWGTSESGQLANFEFDGTFSPVAVPVAGYFDLVMEDVASVAASSLHVCTVTHGGELFCWGAESNGRLGNGSADPERTWNIPRWAIRESGADVTDAEGVALGERHGCIRSSDGTVSCWGDNEVGQLGDDGFNEPFSSRVRRVPGLSSVSALAAGQFHTCALSEEQVLCWGSNGDLQLGHESDGSERVPTVVEGLDDIVQIGAGAEFTCARDSQGRVYCWGGNAEGQRGDDDPQSSAVPSLVVEGTDTLAVGLFHACARTGAQVVCWGNNIFGQLGLGLDRENHSEPSPIEPLERLD